MIICICAAYRSSNLLEDIKENKTLKEIVSDLELEDKCKKCCKFLKAEYQEGIKVLNI